MRFEQHSRAPGPVDRIRPAAGPAPARRRSLRYATGYLAAVAAALGLAVLITSWGARVTGEPTARQAPDSGHAISGVLDTAGHFLLVVALVIALTNLAGRVALRLGQPPVVGELVTGLLLGPMVLGLLAPGLSDWLFSPTAVGGIGMTAQLGLVAFMFLMGTEVQLGALRGQGRVAATVSLASMAVPFLGGLLLAVPFYAARAGQGTSFIAFALFLALAISITALPVLARILADRGMVTSRIGTLALVCAASGDVCAWGALALVLSFAGASSFLAVGVTVALSGLFVAVALLVVRPALNAAVRRAASARSPRTSLLPVLIVGALLAAVTTQLIGIHAVFGAFLFGVVAPRHPLVEEACRQIRLFTVVILLPLFFAETGLKTSLANAGSAAAIWWLLLAVLLVAVVAKVTGAGLAARLAGTPWREAATLGVLMNCRGLTELVVADIGLQLGVIDRTMFTVLVLMAAITTALTAPLLSLVSSSRRPAAEPPGRSIPEAEPVPVAAATGTAAPPS